MDTTERPTLTALSPPLAATAPWWDCPGGIPTWQLDLRFGEAFDTWLGYSSSPDSAEIGLGERVRTEIDLLRKNLPTLESPWVGVELLCGVRGAQQRATLKLELRVPGAGAYVTVNINLLVDLEELAVLDIGSSDLPAFWRDGRYTSISRGGVTVLHRADQPAVGEATLTRALDTKNKLRALGWSPRAKFAITVVEDATLTDSWQGAGSGGLCHTDSNMIYLPRGARERAVAHEIVHLNTRRTTPHPGHPAWLEEGVADYLAYLTCSRSSTPDLSVTAPPRRASSLAGMEYSRRANAFEEFDPAGWGRADERNYRVGRAVVAEIVASHGLGTLRQLLDRSRGEGFAGPCAELLGVSPDALALWVRELAVAARHRGEAMTELSSHHRRATAAYRTQFAAALFVSMLGWERADAASDAAWAGRLAAQSYNG